MSKILYNNYTLSILFLSIPFLEFINTNFHLVDKSIIFILLLIFLSIIIILFSVNIILNKIKYFDSGFYLFFLSVAFIISFNFLDLKNVISNFSQYSFYISIIILLISYLFLFFLINKKKFKIFFCFFAYFSLIYHLFVSYSLISENKISSQILNKKDSHIFSEPMNNDTNSNQNIYYFILDGMTSLKYFKKSFPNSEKTILNNYIDFMKSKKFVINDDTISNYNSTYLSMASLLLLDYPVTETSNKYYDRVNFWPYLLNNASKKPRLISTLEKNNMSFKWYGNITASCKNYSYNKSFCPKESVSNFFYVFNSFFKKTPLITFLRKFFPKLMLAGYGDNIDAISNFLNDFDNLNITDKKFYLIHHLAPHAPYIHNSDCSLKNESSGFIADKGFKGYEDAYFCALKRINQAIKKILKKDPYSFIVFTADHGWILENKNNVKNKEILRFEIFNAFKIEDDCNKLVPEKLDSISTIRLVLGCNINRKPIFTNRRAYLGYQEINKNFGKVFRAF